MSVVRFLQLGSGDILPPRDGSQAIQPPSLHSQQILDGVETVVGPFLDLTDGDITANPLLGLGVDDLLDEIGIDSDSPSCCIDKIPGVDHTNLVIFVFPAEDYQAFPAPGETLHRTGEKDDLLNPPQIHKLLTEECIGGGRAAKRADRHRHHRSVPLFFAEEIHSYQRRVPLGLIESFCFVKQGQSNDVVQIF